MSPQSSPDSNLAVYRKPDVAEHYARLDYLTPCERLLFDTYIRPGMAILDVGVGGGRTAAYLSSVASRYVGVDYSPEMVALCRSRYPSLDFRQADASDLSAFADCSFDAVVIAFNGIDYLSDEGRNRCFSECGRVLSPTGVLIFSSHNPRAMVVPLSWNRERVRRLANGARNNALRVVLLVVLSGAALFRGTGRAVWGTLRRMVQRLSTAAFWRGQGYILDRAHGGLVTHTCVPAQMESELRRAGFQVREIRGDDYPRRSGTFVTDWYYYVCSRSDSPAVEPLASNEYRRSVCR